MTRTIKPGALKLGALLLALFAATATLSAQSITGQISGNVTDASGALVPNATVTIVNSDTGIEVRTVTTDSKGNYTVPLLQVGTYTVRATANGFALQQVDGIALSVSDARQIDLKLRAATSQSVDVDTGTNNLAPQTDDAAASSVVGAAEIKELALNTRNFEQLVLLQPGVSYGGATDQVYTGLVQPNGQNNQANTSINGLRSTQNAWLLDGADMLSHSNGQQVVIFPSIDALQETKTLRNSYGAQYGGGGSAQIQVVTKAGGNEYHGDAFVFVRNAVFNANSYFGKQVNAPRPEDSQYNGGFTFGGPLWIPHLLPKSRSNTFFFYSLDVRRDSVASVVNTQNAPSALELQGIFPSNICLTYASNGVTCTSQSTTVPSGSFNNVAQAYIKDVFKGFPALNNPNDPQGLILNQLGIHNETENLFRIDHVFSSRISAFFRYVHDPIYVVSPAGLGQAKGFAGLNTSNIDTFGTSYLAHATFALTPRTVLDAAFSYQPYGINAIPVGTFAAANAPDVEALLNNNLPFQSVLARVPTLSINSSIYGVTGPSNNQNKTYQEFANLFHVFGQHSVSVGINIEHYSEVINQGGLNAGQYNFSGNGPSGSGTTSFLQSLANFELGRITSFQQNSIDPVARPRVTLYEGYVQDDWRAASRLTLNLGVRYSLYQQPTEQGNHLGSFNPAYYNPTLAPTIDNAGNICTVSPCPGGAAPNPAYNASAQNGLVQGGINSPFGKAVSPQPWLNFAPRIGMAFNVFGDGKTTLRAGYGIYYNQTQLDVEQQTVFNNPAYVLVETFNAPASFQNPGTNAANAPLTAYGISGRWKTPYTQSYSLDLQQQLPGKALLDIAYAGNTSRHLIGQLDINQPQVGQFLSTGYFAPTNAVTHANTPKLNGIRPYLGYGTIIDEATVFTANYNALQTTLNKSIGKNSRLSLNYTWSRGMTTNQNDTSGAPQNTYDIHAENGPVAFDRRNVFTAHYVYFFPGFKNQVGVRGHLLGGWEMAGIVTAASGLPLTVISSNVDPAGQGILAAASPEIGRTDMVGNPNFDAQHTQLSWFNPADFPNVPTGQYRPGNEKNGALRGPGYQVWNVDVFKNVQVSKRFLLQFRVEAFNVWNHTNFTTIDVNNSDVGTALQAGSFGQAIATREPRQMQLGAKLLF